MSNDKWIPEICYEEDNKGVTGGFPFINVPKDKSMPSSVFIFESRDIKEETEDDLEVEITMHMYANMNLLKQRLDLETINKVREALGLEELSTAEQKGKIINDSINSSIESNN